MCVGGKSGPGRAQESDEACGCLCGRSGKGVHGLLSVWCRYIYFYVREGEGCLSVTFALLGGKSGRDWLDGAADRNIA